MENIVISAILFVIIGSVVCYLVKAKKRGESCIGCPYAKQCQRKTDNACKTPEA